MTVTSRGPHPKYDLTKHVLFVIVLIINTNKGEIKKFNLAACVFVQQPNTTYGANYFYDLGEVRSDFCPESCVASRKKI